MKNITSIFTFAAMLLLSIPITKYFSKVIRMSCNASNGNSVEEQYDLNLRNYHPNKGE